MIVDSADRMFRDLCEPKVINAAEEGQWPTKLWNILEESGLTHIAVPEEKGGGGGNIGDAMAVLSVAASYSAPLPLTETMLAGLALSSAGQSVPTGRLGLALSSSDNPVSFVQDGGDWTLNGSVAKVAWASEVDNIAVIGLHDGRPIVALVPATDIEKDAGVGLAGEPQADLSFDGLSVTSDAVAPLGNDLDLDSLFGLGAMARSQMIAGALESVLDMTVQYTLDRVQFGRPIAKFQAVQQALAIIAGEVAAARTAADVAVKVLEDGGGQAFVAVAKARASESAGKASELAHQAHGAIGFTHEHNLHHRTRRLWSWRDDFGNEFYWQEKIGREIASGGADNLWPHLTGT